MNPLTELFHFKIPIFFDYEHLAAKITLGRLVRTYHTAICRVSWVSYGAKCYKKLPCIASGVNVVMATTHTLWFRPIYTSFLQVILLWILNYLSQNTLKEQLS